MKHFLKENCRGIAQSLIASVIIILLFDPLIRIARDVISKGAIALVDYFFYSCAHADGIVFLSTLAIYAFIYFIVRSILDLSKDFLSESRRKEKPSKKLKSQNQENAVDQTVNSFVELTKLLEKEKRLTSALNVLSIICIIIYALFLLNTIIYQFFPVTVKKSFEICITQITPYVENEEIELLQSDWICMETKADYDAIVEKISRVQEENNLK